MSTVDALIDIAISRAEIEHGRQLKRYGTPAAALTGVRVGEKTTKMPDWSEEENNFLRAAHGLLSEEDIASELGRTVVAVHLHWKRDLHLPSPSKAPNVLSANKAAKALGVDGHITAHWVDKGLIQGRLMPDKRKVRLIERVTFLAWACAPRNWVYFDPKKVQDPHLKRLIRLEMKRWGDEWWSTRRAADYHGVDAKTIQSQIKMGRLPGSVHLAISRCGRHEHPAWSNWFVLRSQVKNLSIPRGRGRPGLSRKFSKAADTWILKARDELGMTFAEIGRTMRIGRPNYHHRSNPIIAYRYRRLRKQNSKGRVNHVSEDC